MIDIIKAAVLGFVQGITEFLPVSSSAHLSIFPWALGWEQKWIEGGFDLALHIGTLFAILIFFFKDWIKLIVGGWNSAIHNKKSTDGRIFWYLVFATVPAGIIGAVCEKIVDDKIVANSTDNKMRLIAVALIVVGVVLYIVDKNSETKVSLETIKAKPAIIIGLSQILAAALPGTSRSGITMAFGRASGLDRESAAKYSFLLSAPIIAGGALITVLELVMGKSEIQIELMPMLVGILTSFISGIVVIKFFMKLLKKISFKGFAIYRVILGIVIIVLVAVK